MYFSLWKGSDVINELTKVSEVIESDDLENVAKLTVYLAKQVEELKKCIETHDAQFTLLNTRVIELSKELEDLKEFIDDPLKSLVGECVT
jgi:hypothetical protein